MTPKDAYCLSIQVSRSVGYAVPVLVGFGVARSQVGDWQATMPFDDLRAESSYRYNCWSLRHLILDSVDGRLWACCQLRDEGGRWLKRETRGGKTVTSAEAR